jgi:Rrf2 family protein
MVYISAKADYALRALVTLTAEARPMTADALATSQQLPVNYLENILLQLRRSGLVASQKGPDAGYRLTRSAADISAADVMRAVDGPLAEVRGLRPEDTNYQGPAESLQELWVAVRASLRSVLEQVSLAELATGRLPRQLKKLVADPEAWLSH